MNPADFQLPKEIIVHGILLPEGETDGIHRIRVFPGFTLEVSKDQIDTIERASDEATGREYVKVKLKENAEIRSVFQPRLARLVMNAEGGVPFAFGGGETSPFAAQTGYVPPVWPVGGAADVGIVSEFPMPSAGGLGAAAAGGVPAGSGGFGPIASGGFGAIPVGLQSAATGGVATGAGGFGTIAAGGFGAIPAGLQAAPAGDIAPVTAGTVTNPNLVAQAANQTVVRKFTLTTGILTGSTPCRNIYGVLVYGDDFQPDQQRDPAGTDMQNDSFWG